MLFSKSDNDRRTHMTTLDGKQIVHRETVLVFDKQVAEFNFSVENWRLNMAVVFDPVSTKDRGIESSIDASGLRWQFNRWTDEVGMSLSEAIEVGKSPSGKSIKAMVFFHRSGNVNRLDLQFFVGA